MMARSLRHLGRGLRESATGVSTGEESDSAARFNTGKRAAFSRRGRPQAQAFLYLRAGRSLELLVISGIPRTWGDEDGEGIPVSAPSPARR
jgi:hypothetical protein